MNVDLRKLRALVAVGHHGGFGRAAAELGLSQSAISVAIRRLEAELGVRLLDRTTRSVQPTAAGARLLPVVARLLEELDAALKDVRETGRRRRGRVTVACLPSVAARLMPTALARTGRDHPEIDAVTQDVSADEVLRLVESGAVDFGISNHPIAGDRLLVSPLLNDPFCLVCRHDDPLAAHDTVSWRDLHGRHLVLPAAGTGSRRPIDEALARQSIVAGRTTGLGHPAAVAGMVEAGLGVAILPELAAPPAEHPVLATRLLTDPGIDRVIVLLQRRDRSLSPAAQALFGVVVALFAEPS